MVGYIILNFASRTVSCFSHAEKRIPASNLGVAFLQPSLKNSCWDQIRAERRRSAKNGDLLKREASARDRRPAVGLDLVEGGRENAALKLALLRACASRFDKGI